MFKKLGILLTVTTLFTSACSNDSANAITNPEKVSAQMLVYQIDEQGIETWFSRILVTDAMIRLDEPEAGGGPVRSYTLYDRGSHNIYNIDLEVPSAFKISPPEIAMPNLRKVDISIEETPFVEDETSGLRIQTRTLRADGENCLVITNTDGQLDQARNAMSELYATLAKKHAMVLADTPEEFVTACDMAEHVMQTDFKFGKGVMMSATGAGEIEKLVDFRENEVVDKALFELPEGIKIIAPNELSDL